MLMAHQTIFSGFRMESLAVSIECFASLWSCDVGDRGENTIALRASLEDLRCIDGERVFAQLTRRIMRLKAMPDICLA